MQCMLLPSLNSALQHQKDTEKYKLRKIEDSVAALSNRKVRGSRHQTVTVSLYAASP